MSTDEPLSEAVISAHLPSEVRLWVQELRVHAEIDSTNTHLIKRAAVDQINGVICFAESQTEGRGPRGRVWLTPPRKSIALSIGINIGFAISDVSPLSLVVGVGVADALLSLGMENVSLKWPNDLLLSGAKVGGILVEL